MLVGLALLLFGAGCRERSSESVDVETAVESVDSDAEDLEWYCEAYGRRFEIYSRRSKPTRIVCIQAGRTDEIPASDVGKWFFGAYVSHLELCVFYSGSGTGQHVIWVSRYRFTDEGIECVADGELVSNRSSGIGVRDEQTGQYYYETFFDYTPLFIKDYYLVTGETESYQERTYVEDE